MIPYDVVATTLIGFTVNALRVDYAKLKLIPLNRNYEYEVFDLLRKKPILTDELIQTLPREKQKVIQELLTQYLVYFSSCSEVEFPVNFLDNSNSKQLGEQIVKYMIENSWPYPEMLKTPPR